MVMCDRAKMYWWLPRLQWCWAHLKRDFQALIDSNDRQEKRLGRYWMRPTRALFRHRRRDPDGTITRLGLKGPMHPIRREVESLLLRGNVSGNMRPYGICRELYDHREWLWTFLDVEGIEPTNNGSERSSPSCCDLAKVIVRHAECARKNVCRNDPHRRGNVPATVPQCLRLRRRSGPSPLRPSTCPVTIHRAVIGYAQCSTAKPRAAAVCGSRAKEGPLHRPLACPREQSSADLPYQVSHCELT